MADIFSKEKRSDIMRRITGKNTKPEMLLRRQLWTIGVRGWRVHPRTVPGRPDLTFTRYKLAVFVDGCFWHGCELCYQRPQSNQAYWDDKKRMNAERDRKNDLKLSESGWITMHFWEHEVEKDSRKCAQAVRSKLTKLKSRIDQPL